MLPTRAPAQLSSPHCEGMIAIRHRKKKQQQQQQQQEASLYRCPGCGEMVDNRRVDEIQLHHRHMIEQPIVQQWLQTTGRLPQTVKSDGLHLPRS